MHPTLCWWLPYCLAWCSIESSIIGEQKSPVIETTSRGQNHRSKLASMVHRVTRNGCHIPYDSLGLSTESSVRLEPSPPFVLIAFLYDFVIHLGQTQ